MKALADAAPEGKLDLLMTIDFRQTSTTIFSDVVLPAATWYEKHDLNTTDMHPFVHSFNPAISPPWQSKTDWEAWKAIAKKFSELAVDHLGTRRDVVAKPLWHDTPEAMATVHGVVKDWRTGECEPVPGRTMPVLAVVEQRLVPALWPDPGRAEPPRLEQGRQHHHLQLGDHGQQRPSDHRLRDQR